MTPSGPAVPPEAAAAQLVFQIATGHFAASALQVVAKLQVADQLALQPSRVHRRCDPPQEEPPSE